MAILKFTPAEIRQMTPRDTIALIDGWNEAHSDDVAPPTRDEVDALREKYA